MSVRTALNLPAILGTAFVVAAVRGCFIDAISFLQKSRAVGLWQHTVCLCFEIVDYQ